MSKNRTVAEPSVSAVKDVTEEATRALARANYQARKQSIAALEDTKAQHKAKLDLFNEQRAEIVAFSRALCEAMDLIDAQIAELKAGG